MNNNSNPGPGGLTDNPDAPEYDPKQLTKFQIVRTRVYLAVIGMVRRVTLGTRVMMIRDGSIYLIRHTYLPGWQFPGGGVEPGETAEEGAAREVMEESGYRATGPMTLAGLYLNANPATNRDHIAFFVCREFEKASDFAPNREIAEFGWFPIGALPKGTTSATARRVREVFANAARSQNW